jgi:hypothetical protein
MWRPVTEREFVLVELALKGTCEHTLHCSHSFVQEGCSTDIPPVREQ